MLQLIPAMLQKMEHKLVRKMDQIQASQQTVLETVDSHTAQIASIDARVHLLETNQSQHTAHEVPQQVAQLQQDVKDLSDKMHDLSRPCPFSTAHHTPQRQPSSTANWPQSNFRLTSLPQRFRLEPARRCGLEPSGHRRLACGHSQGDRCR